MKNRYVAIFAILLGFPLLGSARAESWNSKLADTTAAAAGAFEATSEEQTVAAPLANDAEQQAPKTAPTPPSGSNAQDEQK